MDWAKANPTVIVEIANRNFFSGLITVLILFDRVRRSFTAIHTGGSLLLFHAAAQEIALRLSYRQRLSAVPCLAARRVREGVAEVEDRSVDMCFLSDQDDQSKAEMVERTNRRRCFVTENDAFGLLNERTTGTCECGR